MSQMVPMARKLGRLVGVGDLQRVGVGGEVGWRWAEPGAPEVLSGRVAEVRGKTCGLRVEMKGRAPSRGS